MPRKKGRVYEVCLGICEEHVGGRPAHRRADLPRRITAPQSDAVGPGPGAATCEVTPTLAPRGQSPLAAPGVDYLFPHRSCRPRPNGARAAGASGAVAVRTHPRLRPLSEFDPTPGRRESRKRVAAGAGRD